MRSQTLIGFLFAAVFVFGLVVLALLICISSDRIGRRRRLNRLRKQMQYEADLSDEEFVTSFRDIGRAQVLEMRRMLAEILGVDARKIRPDWRFRDETNLKNPDFFAILHAFALRYAPESVRTDEVYRFSMANIATVSDLFRAAWKLQTGG